MPKKDDGGLRLCVDYRGLNAIIILNRDPLPLKVSSRLHYTLRDSMRTGGWADDSRADPFLEGLNDNIRDQGLYLRRPRSIIRPEKYSRNSTCGMHTIESGFETEMNGKPRFGPL